MESIRATAIRVCGAATLVVVCIALVEVGQRLLGVDVLPKLHMALGAAVLVAGAAFAVANAPRRSVAESICVISVALLAVLSVLYVYKVVALSPAAQDLSASSLNIPDGALVLCSYALLWRLCQCVMHERSARAAA